MSVPVFQIESEGYDEGDLYPAFLKLAHRHYVTNKPVVWIALGNRQLIVPRSKLAFDLRGTHSLRSKDGGVYRINVESFLSSAVRTPGFPFDSPFFSDVDMRLAIDLTTSAFVELTQPGNLHPSALTRQTVFSMAGVNLERVEGSEGIEKAHLDVFDAHRKNVWIVDDDFEPYTNQANVDALVKATRFTPPGHQLPSVHIWYTRNPVNDLVYGHGGPKLFPRIAQTIRKPSELPTDFTLSVGAGMVVHEQELGVHRFNTSVSATWKTAAKEAAKLTYAANNGNTEASRRLKVWLTVARPDAEHGEHCLNGAAFGNQNFSRILSDPTCLPAAASDYIGSRN